ncbi:MAG: hypothetical protein KU29_12890 [Sulfurovum sp. FS06-10]|jgi:ribonuclease T2|nr:MAG: hypothetical protein KU29_12890 [Sulfurovum sp. FS06-10]
MHSSKYSIIAKLIAGLMLVPIMSLASVKIDGYFIAKQECTAVHSIKHGTLPVTLTKNMAYKVTAKNKPDATHYQIILEDVAENPNKWVSTDCGILLTNCTVIPPHVDPIVSKKKEYLLAISWQPAFCQTHRTKKECETQTEERYDATHLALHGLWPQPRNNTYCNVSDRDKSLDRNSYWEQLESLHLPSDVFSDLLIVMPGVGSYLQRHEWIKHGTCYSDSPVTYYKDSMRLVNQLNDTNLSSLFANNVEKNISTQQIRDTFNKAFGQGSGDKINVQCDHGLITELWINLKGDITNEHNLSKLLKEAPIVNSACSGGKVDAVGF